MSLNHKISSGAPYPVATAFNAQHVKAVGRAIFGAVFINQMGGGVYLRRVGDAGDAVCEAPFYRRAFGTFVFGRELVDTRYYPRNEQAERDKIRQFNKLIAHK